MTKSSTKGNNIQKARDTQLLKILRSELKSFAMSDKLHPAAKVKKNNNIILIKLAKTKYSELHTLITDRY